MDKITRRKFAKGAAAAAFGFQVVPSRVFGANERINLAGIGTGGKGASDIAGSDGAGFNIIALCDVVDASKGRLSGRSGAISGTRRKYPDAKFYADWREMLEKEPDINAVTVSTPDHVHAMASIAAMKKGIHVYCQKPLSHDVWEARMMTQVAKETGVKTQMGNQAHAHDTMRRMVELVQAGIIGDVKEVHTWTNRPIWPQAVPKFPEKEPVPDHINWDLWVGPAPFHDYSSKILPFNWRGYWDYGTGALGDMACHIMDMSYWSLGLGSPTSVEAVTSGPTEASPPIWSTITYEFPARGQKPPVKYVWYDGYKDAVFNTEKWALVNKDDASKKPSVRNTPPLEILEGQNPSERGGYGTVMVGSEGKLFYSRAKDNWFVKPSSKLDGFDFPKPTLQRARDSDPHKEFYDAIKNDGQALGNFDYSGPFTETVLLGNLAVKLGKKIHWDGPNLKVTNAPEADALIKRAYRDGWKLDV